MRGGPATDGADRAQYIIGRSFDSPEAAIATNFVRATGVQGKKIAPEKRIYATLAVSGGALINVDEPARFLNQLIALKPRQMASTFWWQRATLRLAQTA